MVRIVFYTGHGEIVGGDIKYLLDILQNIDRNRVSVSLYTDRSPVFEQRIAGRLRSMGVDPVYLDTRPRLFQPNFLERIHGRGIGQRSLNIRLGRRTLFDFFRFFHRGITLRRIRDAVANYFVFRAVFSSLEETPDVFHFNNGGYPAKEAGLIALALAKRRGIRRRVMTVHNVPSPRAWFRPMDFIFDFLTSRSCTHIIAASEKVRQELIERRGFPADKITTLYCGLEDKPPMSASEVKQQRSLLGIGETTPVVLICGNLDEDRKGHALLFRAVAKARESIPNLLLLVIGSGGENRMTHFRRMIDDLNIRDNVRFLGYREDIHELNSLADVAVVPSEGPEATPYTIKEASRAGRPVITTWSGGCAEAVTHGETGLVLDPGDEDALSRALISLLKDEMVRASMGAAGRKFFLEKFLLSEQAARHESIYSGDERNLK